jgi:hypothetical protein
MIWLLHHPFSRQKVVSLSQSSCVSPVELTDRRGGGAKSYNGKKAWSLSFNTIWIKTSALKDVNLKKFGETSIFIP